MEKQEIKRDSPEAALQLVWDLLAVQKYTFQEFEVIKQNIQIIGAALMELRKSKEEVK